MANKKEAESMEDLSYLVNDALEGFEKLNTDVIALPFIRILQSMSPQLKKTNPDFIQGAEEGDLFNNITKGIYAQPLRIVPLKFDRQYICWKPDRGGYAGAYSPEWIAESLDKKELFTDDKGHIVDVQGNTYTDTYTYFVFLVDRPAEGVCLLTFSSTQLKEARRWNRVMTNTLLPNGQKALPYHTMWDITTVPQQNKQGEWYGYHISFAGLVQKETFSLVREERQAIPALTARVDYSMAIEAGSENSGAIDVTPDDTPF